MTPNPNAKESGDAAPPSSSSSSSCWWIVAAIPLVLIALIGLDQILTSSSPTNLDASTTTTPGLDYGTGNMFDKIATRYDTINRVLAMNMDIGWRRAMTQRIKELLLLQEDNNNDNDNDHDNNAAPWRILDMATGTADVALQLVNDLDSASHPTTVLGLDPSENMLSVGRSKIQTQNLQTKIVLETADARNLQKYYTSTNTNTNTNNDSATTTATTTATATNNLFDAATMAFGIRNVVPNRSKALCEIHKLLKPNGVLAILEFSDPSYESDGILGAGAGVFIKHVVPFVGGLLSGGARQEYKHLQNSIKEFPAPKVFKQQLQDLECPLEKDDEGNHYFYVGHYDMEDIVHMNFGSVQLYIGRASVKRKQQHDTKLPPIGAYA